MVMYYCCALHYEEITSGKVEQMSTEQLEQIKLEISLTKKN